MQTKILLSNKKSEIISYYFKYTILFIFVSLCVFSYYIFTGRNFVYDGDGINQYLPVYIFWGRYLRTLFSNIFIYHTFSVPQWDFSIGEGNDIITTLSYNIVGDPFCFFSFLIPSKYMHIYYNVMSLLRLYFAGLTFSHLCIYKKQNNIYAILTGTICYTFFYYSILNVTRHPHFLNVLIYFPLTIAGAEKIINRESPLLFIFSIFISALTSFYFFYMLALLTIVFVFTRLILIYKKDLTIILKYAITFLFYGILGMCMAAAILFPTIYAVLKDSREGMFGHIPIFYELKYYCHLPSNYFTITHIDNWLVLGFSVISVLPLIKLLTKKDKNVLFYLFVICILFIMLPIFGLILNGMQYPSNRWCWATALLVSYILVSEWDSFFEEKNKKILTIIFVFVLLSCFDNGRTSLLNGICNITIFVLFLTSEYYQKKIKLTGAKIVLAFSILSIIFNSFFLFSKYGKNTASAGVKKDAIENLLNNESEKIKALTRKNNTDNSFFRYSGHNLTEDASLISGLSAIQYYISLTNPKIQQFRESIEFNQSGALHRYQGYDDRTFLNAISSVKYFYIPDNDTNPPPYDFTETDNETIYRNTKFLPLAFTYDSYFPESKWQILGPIEKQEVLIQSVVLNENIIISENTNPILISKTIPSDIKHEEGIINTENGFISTKKNAHIYISFKGLKASETYLRLSGLEFEDISEYDLAKFNHEQLSTIKRIKLNIKRILNLKKTDQLSLSFKSSSDVNKKLDYKTKYYTWYANRHNFCINMGYSDEAICSIDITLSEPGLYHLDNLEVICQPMDNYEKQIAERKKLIFENEKLSTNRITGNISVPDTRFLYFSIPYTEGWKAKVDGKSVKLHQANIMHMGFIIEEGEHSIELFYETPMLKESVLISLLAFALFIILVIKQQLQKK